MTNDVKIFAKTIEQEATEQIEKLSRHPVSDGFIETDGVLNCSSNG